MLGTGAVVFLGMDSPEVGPTVVATALTRARRGAAAYMCPATDGGYTLLALPPAASPKIFTGVEWSTENTCLSQANSIATRGIPVLFGPAFHDIDEVEVAYIRIHTHPPTHIHTYTHTHTHTQHSKSIRARSLSHTHICGRTHAHTHARPIHRICYVSATA